MTDARTALNEALAYADELLVEAVEFENDGDEDGQRAAYNEAAAHAETLRADADALTYEDDES